MKKSIKIISLLLGLTALFVSCNKKEEAKQEEDKGSIVKTQKLEMTPITRNLEFSAVLQANERVTIAPTIPGRINKITVDIASRVGQGQLLVEMDRTNYEQAKVAFDNLEVDYGRVSKLNESNNIAKQQYDQVKTQYEAQKTSLKNLSENTFLRAPFSGVIETKNFENGELYNGAMPILSLVKLGVLKTYINIPEAYYSQVKKGMPVTLTSEVFPDETFNAELEIIAPTIDPVTHSFQVKVKIPNANEKLRPGMYANAAINFGKVQTTIVPYQAVLKQQGSNERYVFINENGIAKRVIVTLGQRFDDQTEIIADEIKEGVEIVVVGQARLIDGAKLTIQK